MAKTTYEYKQIHLPEEAASYMQDIHKEMMKLTGLGERQVRKADIWLAALASFNQQSNEKQLEILRSLGVDC